MNTKQNKSVYKLKENVAIIAGITALSILLLILEFSEERENTALPIKPATLNSESRIYEDSISIDLLKMECQRHKIEHPLIVVKQAVLESGHFKSTILKNNHNLFGMKMPKKRKTTAICADKNGYAIFKNWRKSVEDYALWQAAHIKQLNNARDYYTFLLEVHYNTDSTYIHRLMNINF